MAYWYDENQKDFGSSRQIDFMCDSTADIADLPTTTHEGVPQPDNTTLHQIVAQGSSCLVIGTSSLYMLQSDGNWHEM